MDIELSIVVCTYNRAWILSECLTSLTSQIDHDLATIVEIIVVNNNSTDETDTVVNTFKEPYLRLVHEFNQGLSYARNKGLEKAQGTWVAYLDDDALASENWIKRIFWIIDNYDFDAFGGYYDPWYRDGKKPWYLDSYGSNRRWMKYDSVSELKSQHFSGGNCTFKRELLEDVGGFPTDLGMSGDTIAYGEESYVQEVLREKGYKLGFDPTLVIKHYVAPYKQKISWFFMRAKANGDAYWQVHSIKPSRRDLFATFNDLLRGLFKDSIFALKQIQRGNFKCANLIIYVGSRFYLNVGKIISGIRLRKEMPNQ